MFVHKFVAMGTVEERIDQMISGIVRRLVHADGVVPQARLAYEAAIASYQAAAFFPGGDRLLLAANEEGKPVRLYVQSTEAGGPRAISGDGYRITTSTDAVSPDGRVASVIDAEGRVVARAGEPGQLRAAVDAVLAGEDRQAFTPLLAILSARHENQYSRLFRS